MVDALPVLLKHPFGMGYLGYYYIQNEIQTGVYTVRYIHNDWLQIGLDIGWIPLVLYGVAAVKTWIGKSVSIRNKMILAVLFLHGLFDFDAQNMFIFLIVLLIMSETEWKWILERYQTLRVRKNTWTAVVAVVSRRYVVRIIKCGGIKISETFYMCSASNV